MLVNFFLYTRHSPRTAIGVSALVCLAADNNGHEILLIPSQNHARSVRPVISRRKFTLLGKELLSFCSRYGFHSYELLCLIWSYGTILYMPPTESEAHAIRVTRVVVVVRAIRVDIVEVRRVARIRRTEPPVVGSACDYRTAPMLLRNVHSISSRFRMGVIFLSLSFVLSVFSFPHRFLKRCLSAFRTPLMSPSSD